MILRINALVVMLFATSANAGEYLGDLVLKDVAEKYIGHGPYDPGHTEFELVESYTYVADNGTDYTVPIGSIVNGASIPKQVWSVVGGPWSGKYRNASVFHDYMTENQLLDSDTVHELFYEAMRSSGVGRVQALTMYYAVAAFGPTWDKASGIELTLNPEQPSEEHLEDVKKRIFEQSLTKSDIDALIADLKSR